MEARYRFSVRFRLDPDPGVRVTPAEFETQLRYEAPPPPEDGWLFFRDHLWRGEVSSPDHMRSLAGEALGVRAVSVEFRAFETDDAYLAELEKQIAATLDEFRASSVEAVLSKYFGSRIEVTSEKSTGRGN